MLIRIVNVVQQYKNGVRALDGLSLNVENGEIFTLLGPNGAGKSSLINILTTYYKPTSGTITMLEKDLCKEPSWIRTQIACVAQNISIDLHLSLMENLLFQSRLYKVDKKIAKKRIDYLIESFELSNYLKYPTSSYSGGVKRRLDIAMNMISSPKILFLDEPTVGMDVESRKAMWKMLQKIRDEYKTTIFLTTHYLEEADQLSDTICIMNNGKKVVQGTPESLRNYIRQDIIKIKFSNSVNAKKYKNLIDITGLVKFSNVKGSSLYCSIDNKRKTFIDINKWLLDNSFEFSAIEFVEASLEDVFLSLTSSNHNTKEDKVC
ncbi:MAG: ABC transporter ATP-binding protein [Clostridiales bacterium]